MADCKINPSFLRSFDFKLLHAVAGTDAFRVMSHNPLNGEVLALPFGHDKYLRSEDWGRTFKEFTPTGLSTTARVAFSADFGLNRHAIAFATSTLLDTGEYQNTHDLGILPTGGSVGTHLAQTGGSQPSVAGGVVHANGAFYSTANGAGPYSGGVRWFNDAFVSYAVSNMVSTPWAALRWSKARGQHVYGVFHTASDGILKPVGVGRRAFPPTGFNTPAGEFVSYFVDATTFPEVSDFINYDAEVLGGAAFVERNGTIWRNTVDNFQTWVKGAVPGGDMAGYTFPHLAAGKGRFNDDVLVSLDSSGTKGLLSVDHGVTQTYFDLPLEVAQTLPGGVAVASGQLDMRFPRVYDIKYISDPETNHTKGRWIFCGGLAIWEMIPVYGE